MERRLDPEVCARWRLTPGPVLGDRATGTWAVTREGAAFVVKHYGSAALPDWRYALRVAAALRARGWPTPEPAEEPMVGPDGAWVLFHRLPGQPVRPAEEDRSAEGRVLRAHRDAAAGWFADNPVRDRDAPRSVIHSDFTPWNLLFDNGRLTGVLDFEATHYTFQVADFALSWRGYHDDVLRGYDEARGLSDVEWSLVRPVFWACLFIGVKDLLAAYYSGDRGGVPPDLGWHVRHLRVHSPLLAAKSPPWPYRAR